MTTFNLITQTIKVPQVDFIAATHSNKEFAITYTGNIEYAPFENYPYIFMGRAIRSIVSNQPTPITQSLGKDYKLTIEGPNLAIQCSLAWQNILNINARYASYDDSTGDGVGEFADKEMEDMGWHATDFDLDYRTMVEHIEKTSSGLLFCIEHQEPNYRFSGIAFLDNLTQARKNLKDFCVNYIQDKLNNDEDFARDTLDEDQEKALAFFGIN